MWILPAAFGYTLQAGSIGTISRRGFLFDLGALRPACPPQRSGGGYLAGRLAATIMTGIKSSNLPLLLPCLVAAGPALAHLRRRWATEC